MQIDGYTRLAAVVATPIKHSISPFIHNYAFDKTGTNGVYVAWDIPLSSLAATVDNIRRYNMFGINVSMPYKQSIIPFMDNLTDSAELIGAVNTVINRDGQLLGHNTDGIGFFKSLSNHAHFEISNKMMTIMGAGGAGISIIAQAALNGAGHINVFNQTEFLKETIEKAQKITRATGVTIDVFPIEDLQLLQKKINSSDLLVNATNVGMDGQSMIVPSDTTFPEHLQVADVIYQPFETPFLAFAKSQGLSTINGLGMLLFQAAEAFEAWTGCQMPTDEIWKALETKYNIES